jgi:hypothetical protein
MKGYFSKWLANQKTISFLPQLLLGKLSALLTSYIVNVTNQKRLLCNKEHDTFS